MSDSVDFLFSLLVSAIPDEMMQDSIWQVIPAWMTKKQRLMCYMVLADEADVLEMIKVAATKKYSVTH